MSNSSARHTVVLRAGEDGWIVAECPTIPGCISQGRTRDEAIGNIVEAIRVCLDAGELPSGPRLDGLP